VARRGQKKVTGDVPPVTNPAPIVGDNDVPPVTNPAPIVGDNDVLPEDALDHDFETIPPEPPTGVDPVGFVIPPSSKGDFMPRETRPQLAEKKQEVKKCSGEIVCLLLHGKIKLHNNDSSDQFAMKGDLVGLSEEDAELLEERGDVKVLKGVA
jgi:hypothetical protein